MFKLMVDYLRRPVAHEAFFKKYASKKFIKGMSKGCFLVFSHTDSIIASIHTRHWAKNNFMKYLDDPFSSKDINSLRKG